MKFKNNFNYLLNDITKLKGVGKKTKEILKKKKITNLFDLLWKLPKSYDDRSEESKIKHIQIGKIHTLSVVVKKYYFPRVRNLPNRVICEDDTGKIECVFFNSYEGYIRKILPINEEVTISGKINFFRNNYQITNPTHISKNEKLVKKIHNKYKLTDGITQKNYNKIINQILENLPDLDEWHNLNILNKFNNISWKNSVIKLHDSENIENFLKNREIVKS